MNRAVLNRRLLMGVIGLALSGMSFAAHGQVIYNWFGSGDGVSYTDPLNWLPNAVPGVLDEAKFDQAGMQTVNFTTSPSNATNSVENDTVVYNLAGHTYTVGDLVVGDRFPDVGKLTVNGGILVTTTGFAKIGRNAPATGTLILSNNATMINQRDISVGQSGDGIFQIDAGSTATSLNAFVGDRVGGTGDALIRGLWNVQNTLVIGNFSTGTFTVENGGSLSVGAVIKIGDDVGSSGSLVVDGAGSTASSIGTTTIGNFGQGALTVSNGATLSASALKISDDFQASVLIDNATVFATTDTSVGKRAAGNLTFDNGGVLQTPVVTVINLSTLGGSGTITGTVITSGTTNPGNTLGTLHVNGNYAQTGGAVNIELGGNTLGVDYDQLAVDGTATLGGALNVSLVNGYNPISDQFVILQGGIINGRFAGVTLPPNFTITYEANRVLVTIANTCIADFNGDGIVNTQDFLAFLNAWSSGNTSADIDGNGTVNTLDFIMFLNLWNAGC